MINLVTGLLGSLAQKKIDGVVNKTNGVGATVVTFCLVQLTANPHDKIYICLLAFSMFVMTLRHTLAKIIDILKELKTHE